MDVTEISLLNKPNKSTEHDSWTLGSVFSDYFNSLGVTVQCWKTLDISSKTMRWNFAIQCKEEICTEVLKELIASYYELFYENVYLSLHDTPLGVCFARLVEDSHSDVGELVADQRIVATVTNYSAEPDVRKAFISIEFMNRDFAADVKSPTNWRGFKLVRF